MFRHKIVNGVVVKILSIVLIGGFFSKVYLSVPSHLTSSLAVQTPFKPIVWLIAVNGSFKMSERRALIRKMRKRFRVDAESVYYSHS